MKTHKVRTPKRGVKVEVPDFVSKTNTGLVEDICLALKVDITDKQLIRAVQNFPWKKEVEA